MGPVSAWEATIGQCLGKKSCRTVLHKDYFEEVRLLQLCLRFVSLGIAGLQTAFASHSPFPQEKMANYKKARFLFPFLYLEGSCLTVKDGPRRVVHILVSVCSLTGHDI